MPLSNAGSSSHPDPPYRSDTSINFFLGGIRRGKSPFTKGGKRAGQKGGLREGEAPFFNFISPSPLRERGIKGVRVL